jgi:hypothetical protein
MSPEFGTVRCSSVIDAAKSEHSADQILTGKCLTRSNASIQNQRNEVGVKNERTRLGRGESQSFLNTATVKDPDLAPGTELVDDTNLS